MFLKKNLIQTFSVKTKYNFVYENGLDLKFGTIKLLNFLKKDGYVVKVFSYDDVVHYIGDKPYVKQGNFEYFALENVNFMDSLNFDALRFMEIYIIKTDANCLWKDNIKNIHKYSSGTIIFDNYLEITSLLIDVNCYNKQMLNKLEQNF